VIRRYQAVRLGGLRSRPTAEGTRARKQTGRNPSRLVFSLSFPPRRLRRPVERHPPRLGASAWPWQL